MGMGPNGIILCCVARHKRELFCGSENSQRVERIVIIQDNASAAYKTSIIYRERAATS